MHDKRDCISYNTNSRGSNHPDLSKQKKIQLYRFNHETKRLQYITNKVIATLR